MEDLRNTSEEMSTKEKVLAALFENLPEDAEGVATIERQEIDRLAEQGVSVEDICHEFVRRGFLLHGTGVSGLDTLEPRQANDEGGYEENIQNAVYATDDYRIPIFMALKSNLSGKSGYSITSSQHEDGTYGENTSFSATFVIPSDKIGYVYVLPKDTFEVAGSDSQFVSYLPVSPRFVIPVTLSDFPYSIELEK